MKSNRFRFLLIISLAIVLGLTLTACGGKEEPTPEPPPADTPVPPPPTDTPPPPPTDTPEPTDTPVPPTETPEPEPETALVPFESAEGGYTLQYPDGWFTSDLFGMTMLASNEELLDAPDPGEEGGVAVIIAGDAAEFAGDDPAAMLESAAAEMDISEDAAIVEGPTAVTINGQDAATAVIKGTSDSGTALSAFLTILTNGDRTILVMAVTPAESEAEYRPQLEAIANSIEIGEPTVISSTDIPPSEGTLLYGDTTTGSIPENGAAAWDFIGLEGETIDIIVTPLDDNLDAVINIFDESGASILEAEFDDSFDVEELRGVVLPSSGTFTILIRGFAGSGGDYELALMEATAFEPVAGGQLAYGDTVAGTVTGEDPSTWTFEGQAGDLIDIVVRPRTEGFDAVLDLLDAAQNSVLGAEIDESFDVEELRGFALPADGSYTIAIRGFAGGTGDYELTLAESGAGGGAAEGSISYGDTLFGSVLSAEGSTWTFLGEAGDFVDITVAPYDDGDVDFDVTVDVLDANGVSLFDTGPVDKSYDTESIRVLPLPDSGLYTIVVAGYEGTVGDYDITLALSNGGLPGSIVFAADTLTADDVEGHAFPFTALAGEVVTLQIAPDTLDLDAVLSVYNDDTDTMIGEEVDMSTGFEELVFTVPEDGNYYFLVTAYEGSAGDYEATLLGSDFVLFELAVNDGVIGSFGDDAILSYVFRGYAGDKITFTVETYDDIDLTLELEDLDGNVLMTADETTTGGTETLTYEFTEDMAIYIDVTEFFGDPGQFILTVDAE